MFGGGGGGNKISVSIGLCKRSGVLREGALYIIIMIKLRYWVAVCRRQFSEQIE